MKHPPHNRFRWAVVQQGHKTRVVFCGPLAECVRRAQPGYIIVPA